MGLRPVNNNLTHSDGKRNGEITIFWYLFKESFDIFRHLDFS